MRGKLELNPDITVAFAEQLCISREAHGFVAILPASAPQVRIDGLLLGHVDLEHLEAVGGALGHLLDRAGGPTAKQEWRL